MITQTVEELLTDHVTLDVEGIDRMYLNANQPMVQTVGGCIRFFQRASRCQGSLNDLNGTDESGFCRRD